MHLQSGIYLRSPTLLAIFTKQIKQFATIMNTNKRGVFIVFEGCDRSGKTTQSRLLFELLKSKGVPTQRTNFPDRSTSIGNLINAYLTNAQELSDQVIHLLFSSNRWERVKGIRNDLLAGTTIICDRYAYSGVAYSVAKGLDFDWCCGPDRGLPRPDAVFYLRSKPEQLQARGGYGEERYEKVEMQRQVGEVFDRFCAQESSYWHECDATVSSEELHAQIAAIAEKVLETRSTQPLAELTWQREGI